MNQLKNLSMIACVILIFASCNNTPADTSKITEKSDSTSFDLSKAKSAVEKQNAIFCDAAGKGDSITMASIYADDAEILAANIEPVKKDGIASLWGENIRMGVKGCKLTADDVTGNADMLAETGRYEILGANNKTLDKGKYVVTWRNYNGSWKIFRDIFNTSLPAPTK